jgi:hypothetical protein
MNVVWPVLVTGAATPDYRADMVRFVRDAYALPTADESQIARIEEILRSLELDRAQRIKAQAAHAATPPPASRAAGRDTAAGVPLRTRRTQGARWLQGRRRAHSPSTPTE